MYEIILIGAGGHACSCIDVVELTGQFKIAGLVDKQKTNTKVNFGYSIIGTDDDLQSLRREYSYALVTLGQIKTPGTRSKLFQKLQDLNYILPVVISPRAYVSKNARIGEGTIVMHDTILNSNSSVGKNCIINNKVLIEHDSMIGSHCHISTGAIVNGGVTVGSGCFIGSGAVTMQSVKIGNNSIIGAGAVIRKDVDANQTVLI